MAMTSHFDVHAVRKQFPALGSSEIYFDNAGGTQTLGEVIDSYYSPYFYRPALLDQIDPQLGSPPTCRKRTYSLEQPTI